MQSKFTAFIQLAAFVLISLTGTLHAFINPDFTPIHLINQSQSVIYLAYTPPAEETEVLKLELLEKLKGDAVPATALDFSSLIDMEIEEIEEIIANDQIRRTMLFVGTDADEPALFLIGTRWIMVRHTADGVWQAETLDQGDYQAVWFGAPDMLAAATRQILNHPAPDMPVVAGTTWQESIFAGKIDAPIVAAMPVALTENTPALIHVMSAENDALLRWNPQQQVFENISGAFGINAASQCAAWGDFSGNGKLELASWSPGRPLQIWSRSDDGPFAANDVVLTLSEEIWDMAVVPGSSKSRLAVAADNGVHLLGINDGTWESTLLPLADDTKIQGPAKLLVTDLDGNGSIDVVLIHSAGGVRYQKAGKGFSKGAAINGIDAIGEPRIVRCADFAATGRKDILAIGANGRKIWWNAGDGQFIERFSHSGEFSYISNPQMRDALVTDFNNDGRPDLVLCNPGMGPHYFFSRGFMVYGFAEDLDSEDLPQAIYAGQTAVAAVDLDNRGAEDIVFLLEDGRILVMRRDVEEYMAMAVTLRIAPSSLARAPFMVSAHDGDRFYGVRTLLPGQETAMGRNEPGPLQIRWRAGGADWQEKEVIVEDGRQFIYLD